MDIRHGGTVFLKTLGKRSPLTPLFCRHYSLGYTIENGGDGIKQSKTDKITYLEEHLRQLKAESLSSRSSPPQSSEGIRHLQAAGGEPRWKIARSQRLEPTLRRLSGHALYRVISSAKGTRDYYRIGIGTSYLTMPSKLGNDLWNWNQLPREERTIKVTMDVSDGPHEHQYARKALETDTASRLGVQIQHGDHPPIWLHSDTGTSVVFANSWTDWIEGKITDVETHKWGIDRFPFIGPLCEVVAPSSGGAMFNDVKKRLIAIMKGEPLTPQWKFTRGHEARLARYEDLHGKIPLPESVDSKDMFEIGLAHVRLLGSRRKILWLPPGEMNQQDHAEQTKETTQEV
ncbi:hypothetical protein BDV97DRAFT_82653 [Delphinella strobiligena]|nr:hypothetical protein BDV97DRAFT_82653 [Delphinella strobiligena]